MFPPQLFLGFEGPALALLAITVAVVLFLLLRVAVAIAIRVGIVAAVVFGILFALNLLFGFNPLGLPGAIVVDATALLA